MDVARKWLWDKAGFTLAILVVASFVISWLVPQLAMLLAILSLVLAIIVIVKELQPAASRG
jgi:hypothetical protein